MKNILFYAAITSSMLMMLLFQLESENQIENMKIEIDKYESIIDSLFTKIDTVEVIEEDGIRWYTIDTLVQAIMFIESSNNDSAYNKSEDAVGCLQIRKTMVNDVNRILKHNVYTYNDRWSRIKSIEMLRIYCKHYKLTTPEQIARCWNGGPRGIDKPQTATYWSKVETQIKENS